MLQVTYLEAEATAAATAETEQLIMEEKLKISSSMGRNEHTKNEDQQTNKQTVSS